MSQANILNNMKRFGILLTVVAPIANAAMSVTEVTVMDTPACFNDLAMRSGIGSCLSSFDKLSNACQITVFLNICEIGNRTGMTELHTWMMTNMSSTPIPSIRNGIMG